jgi:hypothetical protein
MIADVHRHIQAERKLSEQLADFAGRWVAVRDHAVVAYAKTDSGLLKEIEGQRVDRVFRVPSAPGAALL